MNSVREVLIAARQKLTPEGAWTQHVLARSALGFRVPPNSPTATCWCLRGALSSVSRPGPNRSQGELEIRAVLVLAKLLGGHLHVWHWNDAPGRTQAEVLALLDRAIEATS